MVRRGSSPRRKAKAAAMAPLHFRGMPRRSRVLLMAFLFFCVFMVLPRSDWHLGEKLLFFFVSPDAARVYAGGSKGLSSYGDLLRHVDPLIGTTNGGHVFPGASLPYGMAKPVADTKSQAENAAGFVSDNNTVLGFSHMHDSGTGGNPSLGNFPLFVHPGCPEDNFTMCAYSTAKRALPRVPDSVFASPGYFRINLTNKVQAEMTATEHVALYRFSFPGTETVSVPRKTSGRVSGDPTADPDEVDVPYKPVILIDTSDLANTRSMGAIQVFPDEMRVMGEGRYGPSFGQGSYEAFFCADFRGAEALKTGTFNADVAVEEPKSLDSIPWGSAGAWLQFSQPKDHHILGRVGLSFISAEQACENAEREVADFDFERVHQQARGVWGEKLSAIQVDPVGVSEDMQTTFWSGLYRTMLSPQNYTGENPLWNSTEPYYDSFYCIWDSFRAQHPLLTIIDPTAQTEMVRALIDIYRNEGKLPDCRMSFCKGYTQGGSNADIVIADAYIKHITDGVDWETAYEAVVSDAEVEPKSWGSEGRGNLVSWHALGYIPWNDQDKNGTGPTSRTISRGVEYAYDDFCISLLADGLGHELDAQKYHGRSGNWRNYWNPEQEDTYLDLTGTVQRTIFRGFMQPRLVNGTFRYHNTRACSPIHDQHSCYFDTSLDTYEGSPWLYSFFVPQDMAALVALMGGRRAFVERLTFFHESGLSYMGNEQGFLPTYQFHYAGRPGLSSYWVHQYIPSQFNATVNGIPGNDDCAMGAFSAFAFMGFFPVAGQDVYLLSSPLFREVRIRARAPGKWAVIRVTNFDPTYEKKYISKARLNGKMYTKNWISHDFFMRGGVLELTVHAEEGTWGTRDEDLPPSYPTESISSGIL